MTGPYSKIGRWFAELLLVFVGVYGAFWLNNFQQHQQKTKRRDQILATLEQSLGLHDEHLAFENWTLDR